MVVMMVNIDVVLCNGIGVGCLVAVERRAVGAVVVGRGCQRAGVGRRMLLNVVVNVASGN